MLSSRNTLDPDGAFCGARQLVWLPDSILPLPAKPAQLLPLHKLLKPES